MNSTVTVHTRRLRVAVWLVTVLAAFTAVFAPAVSAAAGVGPETRVRALDHPAPALVGAEDLGSSTSIRVPGLPLRHQASATGVATEAAGAGSWVDDAGNIRWPPNRGFAGTPVDDVLEVGARVDRYGRPSGSFVSPEGTPYSARSLAPGTDPASHRVYEVIKPIEGVKTGQVSPWFDEVGLGTQHELPQSVQWLIDNGYLREVT